MLTVGQTIKVMITKFDESNKRVSLGMKQLESNPWEGIGDTFKIGQKFTGRVTNITDYGAFVELQDGIEGLVHVSEMSWTKKNVHPSKIVSTSQEVEVTILDIDTEKCRISLGMKQCTANPWDAFSSSHKVGDIIEGEIKNITDFGIFVGLEGDIDGLIHHSDISWNEPGEVAIKEYSKGQTVKAKILAIDVDKERISLGIKQLTEDKEGTASSDSKKEQSTEGSAYKKGSVVTCTVSAVENNGVEVKLADGTQAFIKRSDLSRDRQEQRSDRFAVGDRLDAKVTSFDKKTGKIGLSIKALEVEEQKRAIAEYGSTDSGASLGDILGAALSEAKAEKPAKSEKPESEKTKEAATEKTKKDATGEDAVEGTKDAAEKTKKTAKKASTTKAKKKTTEKSAEKTPKTEKKKTTATKKTASKTKKEVKEKSTDKE